MAEKIVIFGAGDIAQVADFYFRHDNMFEVSAFVVDDSYCKSDTFLERPLVGLSKLEVQYPAKKFAAFVALSYAQMNVLRAKKCDELRARGYHLVSYLSPKASCFTKKIGWNCFILEDNTLQPFSSIGNNVTLWSGNHIGHHCVIDDNTFISSHVVVSGGVKVGKNCFIGVNSTLRDHICIGDGSLIGAGVYINKDTPVNSVYKGPRFEPESITSDKVKI